MLLVFKYSLVTKIRYQNNDFLTNTLYVATYVLTLTYMATFVLTLTYVATFVLTLTYVATYVHKVAKQ